MYFPARCAFDGNLDNGYTTNGIFIIGELLPHGSHLEYACAVSYTLTGSNIRNCDDGFWDRKLPSCKGKLAKLVQICGIDCNVVDSESSTLL